MTVCTRRARRSRKASFRAAALPWPARRRSWRSSKADNDDQRVGIEIVRKAVLAPLRQIAENAGEDGAVISGKVLEKDEYNWGFDAQTGEFKDMVKAGIIDPTKVVRCALQHAASVAGLMITTEAMVADRPEKASPSGRPTGGGMGDMGY